MHRIDIEPLNRESFSRFGQVIETHQEAERLSVNGGTAERFHMLAPVEALVAGRPMISIFRSQPSALPFELGAMERHPFGSQAFVPLGGQPFLVIVAPDSGGRPGEPQAFLAAPNQGVNYPPGTWHAALIALNEVSDFLVVDAGHSADNLETFGFDEPYLVAERAG